MILFEQLEDLITIAWLISEFHDYDIAYPCGNHILYIYNNIVQRWQARLFFIYNSIYN